MVVATFIRVANAMAVSGRSSATPNSGGCYPLDGDAFGAYGVHK
jgi:hypothetical protein